MIGREEELLVSGKRVQRQVKLEINYAKDQAMTDLGTQ